MFYIFGESFFMDLLENEEGIIKIEGLWYKVVF